MHSAPSPTPRRYPIEPLERLIRARLLDRDAQAGTKPIAAELGEDPNTIRRARTNGLQREAAERLAEAAGYLPYEVWPEILDHEIEEIERECAADDCGERFVPSNNGGRHRRYCSTRCANRMRLRRYRARSAERRERDRRNAKAYYEYAKPYVLRRQAAYDREHREQINARRRVSNREDAA